MNWKAHIHSSPKILLGKPVIKGTRLSVEFIRGLFSEGWTEQQVLENYPTLNSESIQEVFAFAAEFLKEEDDSPEDIAEIEAARADYKAGDYTTFDRYMVGRANKSTYRGDTPILTEY